MITGKTRIAAVLGFPVEHSRSPAMLNAAFAATSIDAVMVPMAIAPDDLPAAIAGLRAMRAIGASVTIPHKVEVAKLCDELSDDARAIGAVNCLQFDGAKLVGHNTDAPGFVDGLRAAGFDPAGKRTIVLGAGGAARAIVHATGGLVVSRRPAEWTASRPWSEARAAFADAELVVDTTPIGMTDREPYDLLLDALQAHAWVASLIYHREPALLRDARARGLATHDGAAMLVHQGARAFALWTGRRAPVEAMANALHAS